MLILLGLFLLAAVLRLFVGEPIASIFAESADSQVARQMVELRANRLAIAAVTGGALAVSGVLLQCLLRNALASPYLLGASTGAALGIMIAWTGWMGAWLSFGHLLPAIFGCLFTLGIVYALGQKRGWIDPVGILLIGVVVNAVNSAAIMFLNYLMPHGQRGDLALWMMGYLNESDAGRVLIEMPGVSLTVLGLSAILFVVIWIVMLIYARAMDILSLSESEAMSLGVSVGMLRLILFVAAGLLAALAVVLAGPVGFVGLIAPHIVRLWFGPAHRPVLVGAALLGATLVIAADVSVKAIDLYIVNIGLLPLGAITALLGGPTFLLMLRSRLGRGGMA